MNNKLFLTLGFISILCVTSCRIPQEKSSQLQSGGNEGSAFTFSCDKINCGCMTQSDKLIIIQTVTNILQNQKDQYLDIINSNIAFLKRVYAVRIIENTTLEMTQLHELMNTAVDCGLTLPDFSCTLNNCACEMISENNGLRANLTQSDKLLITRTVTNILQNQKDQYLDIIKSNVSFQESVYAVRIIENTTLEMTQLHELMSAPIELVINKNNCGFIPPRNYSGQKLDLPNTIWTCNKYINSLKSMYCHVGD